jgi:hypothetical protein
MKKVKVMIGCLVAGIVMLNLGCTLLVTTPTPTMGYVKFLNIHAETVSGLTIHFSVRSLSGLGQTWPDVVSYGSQSVVKEVTPHSGDFSISGEIGAAGGAWTSGSWSFSNNIAAGDTVLLTLD